MKPTTALPIVLVDEEPRALDGITVALHGLGFPRIITVADGRMIAPTLLAQQVAAVVLEPAILYDRGREFVREIAARFPEIPVVVLTVINDLHTAVEYMRAGAVDYLVKPVEQSLLASALRRALGLRRGFRAEEPGAEPPATNLGPIVTQNRAMLELFRDIEAIALSPLPALITGESGTGKELVAQALHRSSGRTGELVTVNVAGLDDTLFADTLFGHTRGAFTGADRDRDGLVEVAGDGTIFLDEIGELSHVSQVKLLRLLQDCSYYALGADRPRRSRARVVAATNCDLSNAVATGQFRRDLYYRLRTHRLELPPLRARLDDLPLLVSRFVDAAARALNKPRPAVPSELYTLLNTYTFPGNVRELEAMIFDAVARAKGPTLSLCGFKQSIFAASRDVDPLPPAEVAVTGENRLPTLREAETALVAEALVRADGNQSIAAGLLGLSRQALNKRLSRRKTTAMR